MSDQQKVVEFYDGWVGKQNLGGVNLRHYSIIHFLKKNGLKRSHDVLEIGCGIGTVSLLIAAYLRSGSLLGTDISPKSIESARVNLRKHPKASFMVSDMTDFDVDKQFDVIVMPDVLEHIPIAQHPDLFRRMRKVLKQDGFIFIHIPNPRFLEWQHEHAPEKLQVIDQPLHTDQLLRDAYQNDFYLESLQSYSLFNDQYDYQRIILKPKQKISPPNLKNKYLLVLRKYFLKFFG